MNVFTVTIENVHFGKYTENGIELSFLSAAGFSIIIREKLMHLSEYVICTLFTLFMFDLAFAQQEPGVTSGVSRDVLADGKFEKGFTLTGTNHADKRRQIAFTEDVKPVWTIAQWNSRGTLDRVELEKESLKLRDDYKSVTLDRKTGAVTLQVDASREYEKPRQSPSEPWVHLLLEQSPFEKPITIKKARAIELELDFELVKCVEHGPSDPGLHAAQFSWYLYLKNTNPNSKGYHDFLWFGLALFDNRYEFVPLYAAQDFAMPEGKFIYTLGSRSVVDEKIKPGKRYKIRLDILPEIEKALKTAKENGFLLHSELADLSFDGTNIGWELPGSFDVEATIHQISVTTR